MAWHAQVLLYALEQQFFFLEKPPVVLLTIFLAKIEANILRVERNAVQ